MVYTERIRSTGSVRPLKALHVMAIVYTFGGVSALIALLSKFVVTPLFEQLSRDRSIYACDAQDRLMDLNFKLQRVVSSTPHSHTPRKYVDSHTQTSTHNKPKIVSEEHQNWKQFANMFQSHSETEASELERKIIKSLDSVERYSRALSYGQIQNFGDINVASASSSPKNAIASVKTEIRGLKGAVLSI